MGILQVKTLAASLGVSENTVLFYTRLGFLTPTKNQGNGLREYGEKDMQRLRFILSARQLGFSVDESGDISKETEKGERSSLLASSLIKQRLLETEKSFAEALALRKHMKAASNKWQNEPDKVPTGHMINRLIEGFVSAEL